MNYPSKTISIKYDAETEQLYGDVDGESTPFQGKMLVPDYTKYENVVYYHYLYVSDSIGAVIHKHLDHPYCNYSGNVPRLTLPPVNPAMSYTCPDHGFIRISSSCRIVPTDSPGSYFVVYLSHENYNGYSSIYSVYNFSHTSSVPGPTSMIPVRRGDIIYWGTSKQWPDGVIYDYPDYYNIIFYYAAKELS